MLYPSVDPETVKRKLKFDYLKAKGEPSAKAMEGFTVLLHHFHRPHLVVHDVLQEAANYMQKQFRLRWVIIGLRNDDGMYRYDVNSGMREEAWARHKKRAFPLSEFTPKSTRYNFGEISQLTRIYLEEQNPLYKDEEQSVNRPALLRSKRETDETSLEADFVDTLIVGNKDEMLGWIEYSGTITNEFPDMATIRNIEVISAILGAAIAINSSR